MLHKSINIELKNIYNELIIIKNTLNDANRILIWDECWTTDLHIKHEKKFKFSLFCYVYKDSFNVNI